MDGKGKTKSLESLEREIAVLEGKRESRFRRVQRLYDMTKDLSDPTTARNFDVLIENLDSTVREFEDIIERLNDLKLRQDPEYKVSFQALDSLDDMVCFIKSAAKSRTRLPNSTSGDSFADSVPLAQLPKIELPSFSGDPVKWPVFFDTFNSLINENSRLDNIAKVYYLMGCLKGKALDACSGIPPTAANYPIMWATLVKKFKNTRLLADTYFQRMLEFKPLSNESAEGLDNLAERFFTFYESLRQLEIANLDDFFAASLALSKLDPVSRKLFEQSTHSEIPTVHEVKEFIHRQSDALRRLNKITPPKPALSNVKPAYKPPRVLVTSGVPAEMPEHKSRYCSLCRGPHLIYVCPVFVKATSDERWNLVKKHKLCSNCLSNIHLAAACKSQSSCRLCGKRHHSLLHREPATGASESPTRPQGPEPTAQNLLACPISSNTVKTVVVLPTALVQVHTPRGEFSLRFLVDSGSQAHLISRKCCRELGLRINKGPSTLGGIGGLSEPVRGRVRFVILSREDPDFQFEINALVLRRITTVMPPIPLDSSSRERFKGLCLADPNFDSPGEIHGVLGADVFALILKDSPPLHSAHGPSAFDTRLGYIVMGRAAAEHPTCLSSPQTLCAFEEPTLDKVFQNFLELEEVGPSDQPPVDECEELFMKTTKRDEKGRYVVHLPLTEHPPNFGDSFTLAKNRLFSLERHLRKNPEIMYQYHAGMRDYFDQGHISLAEDQNPHLGYFIPHFAVFKESSSTPVRIVFDASAKTAKGKSLNDVLLTGPKLQSDIQTILLRFRVHPVAVVADIRQMFRNIWVDPTHRIFQRLLWRFEPEEPLKIYQINCVPFGLKCAPFLALRTVKQLAEDEKATFPLAARIANLDMYVDDVVTSIPEEETSEVVKQLVGLFRAGGFALAKWTTNSAEIARWLPDDEIQNRVKSLDKGDVLLSGVKVLGLNWDAEFDKFFFAYNLREVSGTKREILSTLARIWDPLGFLAPVTFLCKVLLKKLWQAKCGWDDCPPTEIRNVWKHMSGELIHLKEISVPRYPGVTQDPSTLLVGFADSSEVGFGAVVYSITQTGCNAPQVTLLIAKSKVAPLNSQSIPRLELCASLLLAKLFRLLRHSFSHISTKQMLALSDSEDVLFWLTKPPYHWKTFVANRVGKIQEILPPECWFHVPGKENIADIISRGTTPLQLVNHPRWIQGPAWLTQSRSQWPIRKPTSGVRVPLEAKAIVAHTTHPVVDQPILDLIERVSSWRKLCRVVVYLLRFGKRLTIKPVISAQELEAAELCLVRVVQLEHFAQDFAALAQRKPVTSSLRFLNPFLQEGCIRVGGRLENAPLPFAVRHPLLLPKKCRLAELIVDHFHVFYLHAGPSMVLALLRQKFWILSARSIVRKRIHLCNRCFRLNPRGRPPPMGALPLPRVSEAKPFVVTGVDYAGPFRVTIGRYRGVRTQKAYVALFVCFSTKAVHLELAADLSTDAFLNCFKRFVARRGPVSMMYSDCGTNFVGAKTQLQAHHELIQGMEFKTKLGDLLAAHKVEWKFNPPSAPHFGGLWESNVKSMKFHLFRVIGNQILSWEEFYTLLTQIEAVLNSRPLCVLSSDPAEPEALTPAHFLTVTPLRTLPLLSPEETPPSLISRKHLLEQLLKAYWKRWRLEYLSSLQPRKRWTNNSDLLTVGSLVIVRDDISPPLHWPLGVIESVHPGADGVVRVATVRVKGTLLRRPVVKLFRLPSQ